MKAFGDTQVLFTGTPKEANFVDPVDCSWYGSAIDGRRGSFALVQEDAGYDGFIGEFLQLTTDDAEISVYCLGATPQISTPLAIARRCFIDLAQLAEESVSTYVRILS
jgi:hypothetical protein